MTRVTLIAEAREFVDFLHRGGVKSNWWAEQNGYGQTIWFDTGDPAPLLNSQHNMYMGVHPCTSIPPKNSKGKDAKPVHVRSQIAYIAAINCLFGEFDGKAFVLVTDDEAKAEQHVAGGTLDEARNRVQKRIFAAAPDTYKALALAHIESLNPVPSAVVDSGGGYHCYWLLVEPYMLDDDATRMRAKHVQYAWVDRIGSDDDAKDLTRILRIPGTQNFKKDYAPNYPTVQFVWCDYGLLYTFDELAALVPPEPAPKVKAPRQSADDGREIQDETRERFDPDFDTIAEASRNCGRLAPWRWDNYTSWCKLGMALWWLGPVGFQLWLKGSRQSAKYQPGDCEAKWDTFNPDTVVDPITLASLKRWADEDDPAGAPVVPEKVQQQLEEYEKRVTWERKILNRKDLKPTEKGVIIGMYDIIAANRNLGSNEGRVPLTYDQVAGVLSTSKSTVGRAVEAVEKVGLWRRDPESKETKAGFEIDLMRIELLPAYDDPTQAPTIERRKQGGARPGAGRKPKCPQHPDAPVFEQTTTHTVKYCGACETILETTTTQSKPREVTNEIQDETEDTTMVNTVSSLATEPEIQDETPAASPDTADSLNSHPEVSPDQDADYRKDRPPVVLASHLTPEKVRFVTEKLAERGAAWAREFMTATVEGWDAWPSRLRHAVEQAEREVLQC